MAERVSGVYESQDGYLFLTGGHHDVLSYMLGQHVPDAASIDNFNANLDRRAAYCAANGIEFSTWVFPDKLYALRDKVPELGNLQSLFLNRYAESAMQAQSDRRLHYPIEMLETRQQCFTRGGTHYSLRGEIEVMSEIYNHLSSGVGDTYRKLAVPAMTLRSKRKEDLGGKITPPLVEKLKQMEPLKPHLQALNGIAGNNGALALIESPEAETSQTLLIFGDSFFRAMLQHLAFRFRRIVFCRSPFFHSEIVQSVAPDVIFCGMAERYLADCAADETRPHFLSYAMATGKPLKPEKGFAELFQRLFDNQKLLNLR